MQKYFQSLISISAAICLLATVMTASAVAKKSREDQPHLSTSGSKGNALERGKGEWLFHANGCFDCHSINGRGSSEGVSLSSVGLRRDRKFLEEQLRDPEAHVKKNQKAFNSEPNLMTNSNLSAQEVTLIVTYLQSLKKPVPKKGQRSKDYNAL